MSFADIINAEQKKLESSQGGNDKVEYPQTKNKRLFFQKNETEILMQILPSAALAAAPFAVPVRKIFLSARSSNGKDISSNFTLDAEPNDGSLLEQKITEWGQRQLIPNGFGGQQTPKRAFLVNCVRVVNVNGQWFQERNDDGTLAVRLFEVPQSGYSNVIRKLQDPLYNVANSELSFMDPNRPFPIKISKPAKGQMEYPVEVYTSIALPPLPQGWENFLENLNEHAVPTERLVNGDKWVQAFIDMKEGRKPNQGQGQQGQAPNPAVNPYATQPGAPAVNPYAAQPQANPYATPPQANPYAAVTPDQYTGAVPQQQVNPYATQPMQPAQPQVNPYAQPQVNPYANTNMIPTPGVPTEVQPNPYATLPTNPAPAGVQPNPYATLPTNPNPVPSPIDGIGEVTNLDDLLPTNMANGPVDVPTQPAAVPTQPTQPVAPPTHNVDLNGNGLMNIDAMLEKELNGGL